MSERRVEQNRRRVEQRLAQREALTEIVAAERTLRESCGAFLRQQETVLNAISAYLDRIEAHDLSVIRAFVERVEKRLPDYNTGKGADSWLKAYRVAVMDELAELERSGEAG